MDYFDDDVFNPENINHILLLTAYIGLTIYALWLAFTMPDSSKKPSHRYNRQTGQVEPNYDELPSKPSRYTAEEKLEILDNHPFFTGICPECGYEFDKSNPPLVHWDCPNPECGWIDDSV